MMLFQIWYVICNKGLLKISEFWLPDSAKWSNAYKEWLLGIVPLWPWRDNSQILYTKWQDGDWDIVIVSTFFLCLNKCHSHLEILLILLKYYTVKKTSMIGQ